MLSEQDSQKFAKEIRKLQERRERLKQELRATNESIASMFDAMVTAAEDSQMTLPFTAAAITSGISLPVDTQGIKSEDEKLAEMLEQEEEEMFDTDTDTQDKGD